MRRKWVRRLALGVVVCAAAAAVTACGCSAKSADKAEDAAVDDAEGTAGENGDDNGISEEGVTVEEEVSRRSLEHHALVETDISIETTYENARDGDSTILADGEAMNVDKTSVNKGGNATTEDSATTGENAAVRATNGASLSLSDVIVRTEGDGAAGVFAHSGSTSVSMDHGLVETVGDRSTGLGAAAGASFSAADVTVHTLGDGAPGIRVGSDSGAFAVTDSYVTTSGGEAPALLAASDTAVSDSFLQAVCSQGIVVDGRHVVGLADVDVVADHTKQTEDLAYSQAVLLMDSKTERGSGTSTFTMKGGSIISRTGDLFCVTNTAVELTLSGVALFCEDESGVLLRALSAGWGEPGKNGAKVRFVAKGQALAGDLLVDANSSLSLSLDGKSSFAGAISGMGAAGAEASSLGEVKVDLAKGAKWELTGDSYVTELSGDTNGIETNGFTLFVDGEEWE